MKKKILFILSFFIICQLPDVIRAKEKSQGHFTRVIGRDYTILNPGKISICVSKNGNIDRCPIGNSYGAVYPRGTAGVIFIDEILWGGLVHDGGDTLIRVGGQSYNLSLQPGAIINKGVAEDPADPDVNRIWRVRKRLNDFVLRQDAAELFQKPLEDVTDADIEELRAMYVKDWLEWPWQKGAPFYDADGDGVYTPHLYSDWEFVLFPAADEPGLANADQVVWAVSNDLALDKKLPMTYSPKIGVEVQTALWGYETHEALGNCIFRKVRIIYKGMEHTPETAYIDNMHIGLSSDPDLGYNGDDCAGCDTMLDLGYIYNAKSVDSEFQHFNLPPPSLGYKLLAGPIVPENYSDDQYAIYNLRIRKGYVNLLMTTFSYFYPIQSDDDIQWGYHATLRWWNVLRGFCTRHE